jgi:hypothetical protein
MGENPMKVEGDYLVRGRDLGWGEERMIRGGEFYQSMLYACMKISQCSPLFCTIYANKE